MSKLQTNFRFKLIFEKVNQLEAKPGVTLVDTTQVCFIANERTTKCPCFFSHMLISNPRSIFVYVMKYVSVFFSKWGINSAVYVESIDENLLNNMLLLVPSCYEVVAISTIYPKQYAHGFDVLCFVVVTQSFIMNSQEVFIHIHQGCFAGTGAIVRFPQCQWSKPDGYGKISQCITTTKHSKAKTVCIFLGIYCR